MNYKEVFKDILYCVEQLGDSEEIVNICSNSKKIGVGDTFLAIVGIKTDGHKYIESAINSGAKVIICNKDKVGTFSAPKDVSVF
ncbi:MAG: UDP-N-acetylmuramoyl-L-alanyl-D-glutamate--2,6-diaminopimelate ligase, partial [Clostridia bacterium]|nr:UDP-N-acetylmuramoyl-L-alanyl-D-glutamate--2,6-diaminopimelate ligase [Clostridia bacterium]